MIEYHRFDGPSHFVRAPSSLLLDSAGASTTTNNNQLRAMGHTVLKYRMLKKQGWTVVRVPYYEYDKIPFWASMVRFFITYIYYYLYYLLHH